MTEAGLWWLATGAVVVLVAFVLVLLWLDYRERAERDAELAALKRRLSPPEFRRFTPRVIAGGRRLP